MRVEPSDSISLSVTVAGAVCHRPCAVQSVTLTPAAAASTVSLYDPPVLPEGGTLTTTGATLLVTLNAVANGASVVLPLSGSGINCKNGCVAVVTGSGAVAFVTVGSF